MKTEELLGKNIELTYKIWNINVPYYSVISVLFPCYKTDKGNLLIQLLSFLVQYISNLQFLF